MDNGEMIYNININQKAIIDSGYKLSIECVILLYTINTIVKSGFTDSILHDGRQYSWVSRGLVNKECPILGDLKERKFQRLISSLEGYGLVVRHPDNQRLCRTYLHLGFNVDKVLYNTADDTPVKNDAPPVKNDAPPVKNDAPPPSNLTHYNNTNENSIKTKQKAETAAKNKLVASIAEYFNHKTGKSIQAIPGSLNYRTIEKCLKKARIVKTNESGSNLSSPELSDVKVVIDQKVTDWAADGKMKAFLRVSTLFAVSNFEKYHSEAMENQKPAVQQLNFDKAQRPEIKRPENINDFYKTR